MPKKEHESPLLLTLTAMLEKLVFCYTIGSHVFRLEFWSLFMHEFFVLLLTFIFVSSYARENLQIFESTMIRRVPKVF